MSPATSIAITPGPFLFEFTSHEEWIYRGASRFKQHHVQGDDVICVDTLGRLCPTGTQFNRARDQSTYPIRVYKQVTE